MRKEEFISTFEKHLLRVGCPVGQARRTACEVSDHFDDLKADALQSGLSEAESEAQASAKLGDPKTLAERLASSLRRTSWWGRHPLVGFLLVPSVGMFLLMTLAPCVVLAAAKGALSAARWREVSDGGPGYEIFALSVQTAFYGSLLALMAFICRRAMRAVVGVKWILGACFLCSLHAAFINVYIFPHSMYVGYLRQPNWFCASIPLLCALAVTSRQWISARSVFFAAFVGMLAFATNAEASEKFHTRGWIGGVYNVVRPPSARQWFFPPPEVQFDGSFPDSLRTHPGVILKALNVETNTPAFQAGLRTGDLIVEANLLPVTSLADFHSEIDECKPGNAISLAIYRDGTNMQLSIPVGQQTYQREGMFAVAAPSFVHGWRLMPEGGLSFVFLGFDTYRGVRQDGGLLHRGFTRSWSAWVGPFQFSVGQRSLSVTNSVAEVSLPRTADAK